MKRIFSILLCCLLLVGLALPAAADEPWSNAYFRIMDTTDSLTDAEIERLDGESIEFMRTYQLDLAMAAIPEARLQGMDAAEFARALYADCGFGYGDTKDGFLCLYLVDAQALTVVPMGGAVEVLPQGYLDYMAERIPALQEKYGVYGVFYGCRKLLTDGIAEQTAAAVGDFARCGEGSDKPAWFPADLNEAYVYYDANAPRVVDYADALSEDAELAMETRIAEISAETGKDIVIVTDTSNYGLGDDIYAADFYDYNGYGLGEEHEGILFFLNLDPEERGGWTAETGSETRGLMTRSTADRLDDFLFASLADGDYAAALQDWIEDVYGLFTTGMVRPPVWYLRDGSVPYEAAVVDEWHILTEEQIATLQTCADTIRETYGVNVYFHTTGDWMGFSRQGYNDRYMAAMGYAEDAVLLTVENTGGDTVEYNYIYAYGNMQDKIGEKFLSRIENNASAASDGYARLYESQRLLAAYLKNGRVPRNGFYWGLIGLLAAVIGFVAARIALSKAVNDMTTVNKQLTALPYLDRSKTTARQISEKLLFITTKRVYVKPRETSSGSSSGGHSTYHSGYSGHSGTSHTGHGRKF